MSDYIPVSFEHSGLPNTQEVKKAYDLVKGGPRAVGSAQIFAEAMPDPKIIAAHLVSFTEPRMDVEEINKQFNKARKHHSTDENYVAEFVEDIRRIYDEKIEPPYIGFSDAVRASFIACAVYDIDATLAKWKDTPLATQVLET